MASNLYVVPAELEAAMQLQAATTAQTSDAARIAAACEIASRWVESATGQVFARVTSTRAFTAQLQPRTRHQGMWSWKGGAWARVPVRPGLVSVTTVDTDDNCDGIYETSWASTDWRLTPVNALVDGRPYLWLERAPNGTQAFPAIEYGVQIAGVFGWPVDVVAKSTISGNINDAVTTVPITASHGVRVGDTIQIGTEQMWVLTSAATSLTVQRGVNGTVAAAHTSTAAVSRHEAPWPVRQAALVIAMAAFKSAEAPFGVLSAPEFGSFTRTGRERDQAMALLAPYRIVEVG